jgi:hypothetical protein
MEPNDYLEQLSGEIYAKLAFDPPPFDLITRFTKATVELGKDVEAEGQTPRANTFCWRLKREKTNLVSSTDQPGYPGLESI